MSVRKKTKRKKKMEKQTNKQILLDSYVDMPRPHHAEEKEPEGKKIISFPNSIYIGPHIYPSIPKKRNFPHLIIQFPFIMGLS